MYRKNAREDGEKPWTWAVPEGGTSGDVAGGSDGAGGDRNPRRGAPEKGRGTGEPKEALKKAEPRERIARPTPRRSSEG